MAKDPAVLFYTSDFLSGTSFFSYKEKGQYMTLLCQQHQLWKIPENHMINICGSLDSPVIKKFIKTEDGFYYNARMREEAIKRKTYCESRSNNKSGRPKKKIIRKSYDKSYDNHKENENDNENIKEFINYFNKVLDKNLKLTDIRKNIIKKRLKEGRTLNQLKKCVDNFSKDEWPDRHKHVDVIYCIGTIRQIDQFDKWIDAKNFNSQGSVEDDERIEASREDYRRRREAGKEKRIDGVVPRNSEDVHNNDGSAESAV